MLPLFLALGVMGDYIPTRVERDLPAISSAVGQVDTGIKNYDEAVKSFNGDPTQLNSAAQSLVNTLNSATTLVQQSSNLTVNDAATLQGSITNLGTDGSTLITDLDSKKPAIQAAGQCANVLQQTTDISNATNNLVNAVVAKLPESVQSVGSQVASAISQILQQPIGDFSAGNCTNSSGSSTSFSTITSLTTSTATGLNGAPTIFANATTTTSLVNPTTTGASPTAQFTGAAASMRVSGLIGALAVVVTAMML